MTSPWRRCFIKGAFGAMRPRRTARGGRGLLRPIPAFPAAPPLTTPPPGDIVPSNRQRRRRTREAAHREGRVLVEAPRAGRRAVPLPSRSGQPGRLPHVTAATSGKLSRCACSRRGFKSRLRLGRRWTCATGTQRPAASQKPYDAPALLRCPRRPRASCKQGGTVEYFVSHP